MFKRVSSLLMVLILLGLVCLSGCNGDAQTPSPSHACEFSEKRVEDAYFRASATCTCGATYYYSCACGAIGEEYFEFGEVAPHIYSENTDEKYLKALGHCQLGDEYYYSCVSCGEISTQTFFLESTGECRYDDESVEARYLKFEATPESSAVYYKSCPGCGAAGDEVFSVGSVLGQGVDANFSKALRCELVDFRKNIYELTWETSELPVLPSIYVRSDESVENEFQHYDLSLIKNPNGSGYLSRVEVTLDPLRDYTYYAYDAFYEVGSAMQSLTTEDTDASSELYLMANIEAGSLGLVLLTKHYTIVFDGGRHGPDGERLAELLKTVGGSRVDAWFFTHPHSDHIGGFYHVVTQHPDIQIGKVYYNCPTPEAMATYGRGGTETDMWNNVLNLFEQQFAGRLYVTSKNEVFTFDQIRIKVLRVYNPNLTSGDFTNEASSVYRVESMQSSLLILGDLGPYAAAEVMQECLLEDLETEYVQMAHHGQGGASKEFYEYITPNKCLWPTPEYLWNNDNGGGYNSGPWGSMLETRKWMEDLGVTTHYIAKDGTQKIPF